MRWSTKRRARDRDEDDELTVEQIVAKVGIATVIEHYGGDLSHLRTGWQKIRCPFHDDAHASGSVNLARNAFKCHACDAQGDVVSLVMQQEGLSKHDAVEFIKRRWV